MNPAAPAARRFTRRKPSSRRRASRRLLLETLENRSLLAALPAAAQFVANEVLVKFKDGIAEAGKANVRALVQTARVEHIQTDTMRAAGYGDLEVLRGPADVLAAVALLKSNPLVDYAEPNWILSHQAIDDPYYTGGSLWGMYSDDSPSAVGPPGTTNQYGSQAEEAWTAGYTGSSTVYVGIIDEGIQFTHPDLAGNVWTNPYDLADGIDDDGNGYIDDVQGWDFAGGNNTIYDGTSDDHGTHVTGTIGGQGGNGAGVAGVNWNVTYISGKFLGPTGGTTANAIKAIDYMTDLKVRHGLNIVATNNSWGGGGFSQGLLDAITRGAKQNILFIAAAGNGGADQVGDNNDSVANYPSNYNTTAGAGYDAVVAVAAITSAGSKSSFSNYGAATVDLGAPGSGIYSTVPTNSYASYSGTSMATPHVTGAAALYASTHGGATAAQIKAAILNSTTATASLSGTTVTGGRLNVSALMGTTPAFSINDVAQAEGDAGATIFTFTVTLSPASTTPVTVDYVTADGTATLADSDYIDLPIAQTLIFLAGEISQTITVTVNGDTTSEANETFLIKLSNAPGAAIADSQGVGTILNDDIPPTKFYVVNDGSPDRTYEYAATGTAVESYAIDSVNTAPRGAASTAVGDTVWVVDANKRVYVYGTSSGPPLGSWTAGSLPSNATVEGIATYGTDVWIVDARSDKVYKYAGAASPDTAGIVATAGSFSLTSGNKNPKDIVTDGENIWVVNDAGTDKVFKYTVSGTLVGSWTINAGGGSPTGITLDPLNVSNLWIVDNNTDRVYQFDNAASRISSSQAPSTSFALAAGNTNPQGIADPPASSVSNLAAPVTGSSFDSALLAIVGELDSFLASGKKRK